MNGKTHRAGGICFGIATAVCLWGVPQTPSEAALAVTLIAGSSVGSLLPDIDHHNSTITNQLKRGCRDILEFPLRLLGFKPKRRKVKKKRPKQDNSQRKRDARRPKAFRHRGITHSPFLIMLVFLLLLLLYPGFKPWFQPYYFMLSFGLFVGMVSHLFLDALTKDGIPLLAPLTYQRFKLMKLTTGKHELMVLILMVIVTTAVVCFQIK